MRGLLEEGDWVRRRDRLTRWIGQGLARLSYAHFVEPVWLETNRIDLPFDSLDPAVDGLRVLHLTDFHLCQRVPASHLQHAVEQARKEPCDLIALTGDFVHAGFRFVDAIAQILSKLQAPLGVYAVLGNHDYSVRNVRGVRRYPELPRVMTDALARVGIRVLHNEHRQLERNGRHFAVVGVADAWSRESDLTRALEGLGRDVPRVVLAHNPIIVRQLGAERADLILSGHTHGGQVHLAPIGPAMVSPAMRDIAAGLYRHPTGYLYVNKGVGYTVRFRYKVRPELAVLRFKGAASESLESIS